MLDKMQPKRPPWVTEDQVRRKLQTIKRRCSHRALSGREQKYKSETTDLSALDNINPSRLDIYMSYTGLLY